ncbi:cytochrome P450 [Cryptosporangium japonicum]|uniref:Cytochrome P450 n=1 Tax=Cryptosporangium japonicum TaxID=80872 RepID=A0ABN0TK58_9ACTN
MTFTEHASAPPPTADDLPSFPQRRQCPYRPPAGYADLRATSPTRVQLYDGNTAWLVTRYDQARSVLTSSAFSSDITKPGFPIFAVALAAARQAAAHVKPLVVLDPPDHTVLRKMVVGEFTVRRMNGLRPQIQETADRLVDAMLAMEPPVNLAEVFSFPMAGNVICHLLGIPYAELEQFMVGHRVDTDLQNMDEVLRNQIALRSMVLSMIEEKEANPGDDVLSRIIAKHVATGALSTSELATLAVIIMGAGYGPTSSMLSLGVALLLDHPDQLAALRDDPTVYPDAVEEVLRYVSVSDLSALRVATADVMVGDQLVRAGEGVIAPNGAANFDPDVFENPDDLDVRRQARQQLAFGHGIHQCLGGNLTRVELEIAYETLFTRIPTLRLAVPLDRIVSREDSALPEVYDVPVTW